jgi:hypothetical protein
VEIRVLSFVDNTHSTTTMLLDNTVVGNGPAEKRRGIWHFARILGCAKWQVNEEGHEEGHEEGPKRDEEGRYRVPATGKIFAKPVDSHIKPMYKNTESCILYTL